MLPGSKGLLAAGLIPLALIATTALAAAPSRPASDPRNLDGTWAPLSKSPDFKPADGKPIPFTPEGKAQYLKNLADKKAGKPEPQLECTPPGLPRLMAEPNLIQVISQPNQINFFHEYEHDQRLIYMDEDQPMEPDPTYLGHSVGHWDGSTLVVDTIAFNEKTRIDAAIPHSDKLHVVEHIRKTGGGRVLEDQITIEDPAVFSRPWTTRRLYAWTPGARLKEFICEEKLFGGAAARNGKSAQ